MVNGLLQASRPPPSIKELRDYGARLEASLRAHILEANLTRERAPAWSHKPATRSGRETGDLRIASPREAGERHLAGEVGESGKADRSRAEGNRKEEGLTREGVGRHKTKAVNGSGVDCHKGEAQKSNGFRRTQAVARDSDALNIATTDELDWSERSLDPIVDEDTLGERWSPSTKRTSSSKVRKFRSLVMDLQTEASGAASLCRAEIT